MHLAVTPSTFVLAANKETDSDLKVTFKHILKLGVFQTIDYSQ